MRDLPFAPLIMVIDSVGGLHHRIFLYQNLRFTLHPCTSKAMVLAFVVVHTKMARSEDLDIIMNYKCHSSVKNVEKPTSFCF
jgi:hypothetical protein